MFYPMLRKLLFLLDPEAAHWTALRLLNVAHAIGLTRLLFKPRVDDPVEVMGLTFPNRVGLAAGYDRNADYILALASLGFGFIEVGTVTPDPCSGRPRPRLFRLVKERGIINRFGFANNGLTDMLQRLRQVKFNGVLGVNIVKNVTTSNEHAVDDYITLLNAVYPYVDYIAINISSPNTAGLRELQGGQYLSHLLTTLKARQAALEKEQNRYVPLVVKVAPDLSQEDIEEMSAVFLHCEIDGVIVTNTALARETVKDNPLSVEQGGLSGAPIFELATSKLAAFKEALGEKVPLIGVGGIMSAEDALKKRQAGADLVQLYTGLIYQGPGLVHAVAARLKGLA